MKLDNKFYEKYFDTDAYEVFRYDVGSFCTRRYIVQSLKSQSGNILEIGVGISSLLEDLQKFTCYGIDISSTAIERSKKIFEYNGKKAELVVGDAQELPFEDNFFDAIVSSHTLEHVEHDENVLKECARVLKPGGEVIFFVPGRVCGTATPDEWKSLGHYRTYNKERFAKLENAVNHDLKLASITFPHKIHNVIWNRMKHVVRALNYPIKKWIMRDGKTYEVRPWYQKFFLPVIATTLDGVDCLTKKRQSNFLSSDFNVLARFEKLKK